MSDTFDLDQNSDGSFGPLSGRIDPNAPDAEEARSREQGAGEAERQIADRWIQGWLIAYGIIIVAIGVMYGLNHWLEWAGMIINLVLVTVFSLLMLPNVASPTLLGGTLLADILARLVPGLDINVTRTYFDKVLPNFQFWSFLAFGSMAGLPWFLGPLWLILPAVAISLFAVYHWWKYRYDSKIIQQATRLYIFGATIAIAVFMLGLDKPVGNLIERINPPTAFSQDSVAVETNWSMDSETGEVFRTLSPAECTALARGYCINEDTGVRLEAYDEDKISQLRTSGNLVTPTSAPVPRLTAVAFEDRTYGEFERITLVPGTDNRVGPITNFNGGSFCHTKGGGTGRLVVWSRTDFESEPVQAVMADDGITISSFGHTSAPWQLFYGTEGGTASVVFERIDRPDAC
jgi:hypothetical protein